MKVALPMPAAGTMITFGVVAALILIVAINAKVTVAVGRSDALESGQKKLQMVVIWLLPVLGAALCWCVLNDERQPSRRSGEGGNEYTYWNSDTNEDHSHSHHGVGHDGS
jgi:ABC-type nickel/cobalt efflux system permease component RcnA